MKASATILVLPGGGYGMHADHEGEPVAEWLRSLGFESRVLKYPLHTRHPGPLRFVQREIAAERESGASSVGVLGFSAGGHLAGLAAASAEPRPDFAILCYPVVSMLMATHRGSREVLLGRRAGSRKRRQISVEKLVDSRTSPTFIWHTVDDKDVPVEHSYRLAAALSAAGVAHELHAFSAGEHGLGFADGIPAEQWRRLCARWLEALEPDAGAGSRAQSAHT